MRKATSHHYRSTASKYKGGAQEMYVTYDLRQPTRANRTAVYPKVKRVYIAGRIKGWHVGTFAKRTGRRVHGVKIDYEQTRAGYARRGYTAHRGGTEYRVRPTRIGPSTSTFSEIVELPETARNVQFHKGTLPAKYNSALQNVR